MLFQEERFGMFVHFGLYAQRGWHEQHMWRGRIPKAEYITLANTFHPLASSADAWAKAAKAAGMQYLCFTVKHHDGFCLWDTKYTDYNIMHTPYGRDLLAQVAEACRRHGLLLELYYSQPDWNHPHAVNLGGDHQLPVPNPGDTPDEERYKDYIRHQLSELLCNYGPIAGLFWDIPPASQDPSINAYARSLQPGILINDRGYDKGDYSTPERHIPEGGFTRLTEACQSVGAESWGYRKNEDYFTPEHLADSVDRIMAKGGNYLLNIGPDGKGRIPPEARRLLRRLGAFFAVARESYPIAGAMPVEGGEVPLTRCGNVLYAHLPAGYPKSGIAFRRITALPARVCVLGHSRSTPRAELVAMPSHFRTELPEITPCLHICGLPPARGMPLLLRMEFDSISPVLQSLGGKADSGQDIL